MPEETPRSVRRSFTTRYLAALCLVGILSTTAFVVLTALLNAQAGDAVAINIAGRQRMLSQRVTKMALRMVHADNEQERAAARKLLQDSVALMRTSNTALTHGDKEVGISDKLSPALQAHYFGSTNLAHSVQQYLGHADALLGAPNAELTSNNADLKFLVSQGEVPILRDLNSAVQIYEDESKARTRNLHHLELGLWLTTLVLLFVEAVLIFRPIVKRLAAQMARVLQDAEQLREKDRRIGLLLDATRDGLLPVDLHGNIEPGASQRLAEWFGTPVPGTPFWDYFGAAASERASEGLLVASELRSTLAMGFQQLADDFLPFELCLDQMVKRVHVDTENTEEEPFVYSLDYREILQDGQRVGFLIVVRDVTSDVRRERAEIEAREVHGILGHVLRDRPGFVRFMQETKRLLDNYQQSVQDAAHASQANRTEAARLLHTIKGNTAIFGFTHFSSLVHAAESQLLEGADAAPIAERLVAAWQLATERLQQWLETDNDSLVGLWLSESEYNAHLKRLEAGLSPEAILPSVKRWQDEPVRRRMDRLAVAAQKVAERLGKELLVEVDDPLFLRLPANDFEPIWDGLVHIVRNAVDHGIEEPSVRQERGKPPTGNLKISCKVLRGNERVPAAPTPSNAPLDVLPGDMVEISVSDDGGGIDWKRLAEKAKDQGIQTDDPANLVGALFADGVSTKDEVSEVSGRGVGLSALYAAVQSRNGGVLVDSVPESGTSFRLQIPLAS